MGTRLIRIARRVDGSLASLLILSALGCAEGGGLRLGRDGGVRPSEGGLPPVRDAGTDNAPPPSDSGSPADASSDAGCTSAADCDDGLFCNGLEQCESGVCVAGEPTVCDDSLACTTDRCVEPTTGTTPSCEHESTCLGDQTCTADGCASSGCSESPCQLLSPQCGCGAGQGCYPSGGTRTCEPAGTAVEGSPCTSPSHCAPGLTCHDMTVSGATPVYQCTRLCATDSDCSGEGSYCLFALDDGSGGTLTGVKRCSRSCDPVTNAGCASGTTCRVSRETSGARYYTDCEAPEGHGALYAACSRDADCRSGFMCADTVWSYGPECLPVCEVGGTDCLFGETCYPFATRRLVGSREYGVCDE